MTKQTGSVRQKLHTGYVLQNESKLFFTSCQAPKPGPYVKEMQDAATFYTNRVLKDYKDKSVKPPLLKPVSLIVRSRWAVQI